MYLIHLAAEVSVHNYPDFVDVLEHGHLSFERLTSHASYIRGDGPDTFVLALTSCSSFPINSMDNWHKRVELLANVAIIFIAIILGAVLVNRYLLSAPTPPAVAERPGFNPGTKLSLPGVEWGWSRRTLLIVLSTNCHYCTESAPFYQKLAQEKTKHTDVGLLAVLPQSVEESQKYLGEHGVKVDDVRAGFTRCAERFGHADAHSG
jgi:hypothetical protein